MLMRTFHERINDGESSLSNVDFDEVSGQVMGKVIFSDMSGSDSNIA